MRDKHGRGHGEPAPTTAVQHQPIGVGKRTLVSSIFAPPTLTTGSPLQMQALQPILVPSDGQVHAAAARGLDGPPSALPHLDPIQRAFGRHDVSGISAHVGGPAAAASHAMGAEAYATGSHVSFAGAPSLHTAAHEAAHVVQQRAGVHLKGGVGAAGDPHEQHADAVADRVVAGGSAEGLLDAYAPRSNPTSGAVQRKPDASGAAPNQSSPSQASPAADRSLPPPSTNVILPDQTTPHTDPSRGETAWHLSPAPHIVRFPATEVGAVSSPETVTLTNRGATPVDIGSLAIALRDFAQEPAHQGEFEIVRGQPGRLQPLEALTVEVVFRPTRVVGHIGAQLRADGNGAHQSLAVTLRGTPVPARADHADQRELSIAQNTARRLETTGAPSVQHYGDMLATVLAARDLTDRASPDDAATRAQIAKLLDPVEKRLNQLNDHQGRLARFGAGNIAGQAALDMSETAVRSWRQRLALGTIVRTEELVTRFRAGAETIRFLTGEHADAPTLREFDHVSRLVGVGAAAPVLAPPLAAIAVEGAALLVFAPRVAASRVALWALHHPAAALAASEALLGFGVQVGEDGWGNLWGQLQDPQGRWFVIAQVIMDFMHVKTSMSGHDGSTRSPRATAAGVDQAPDLEGARQRVAKASTILQQVHDAAANAEPATPSARDPRQS